MSEKNLDNKNRWRNVIVAFRVSPEESNEINKRYKLCGYRLKQDFLLDSALYQKVEAKGNPLMLVQFRKNLQSIEMQLERLAQISEMDEELFTPIRTMLEILEGFERSDDGE